jgi:hypothetical protein
MCHFRRQVSRVKQRSNRNASMLSGHYVIYINIHRGYSTYKVKYHSVSKYNPNEAQEDTLDVCLQVNT